LELDGTFTGDLRRIYQNIVFLVVYKHIKLLGMLLLIILLPLLLQPLTQKRDKN